MTTIVVVVNIVIYRDYNNHTFYGELPILCMFVLFILFFGGLSLGERTVLYRTFITLFSTSHFYLGMFFVAGLIFSGERIVKEVFVYAFAKLRLIRRRRMICSQQGEDSSFNMIKVQE